MGKIKTQTRERRIQPGMTSELRAYTDEETHEMILEGYAAKYNVESRYLYSAEKNEYFIEILEPRAFAEVLDNDVYLTLNHSEDRIYARTVNGTLLLSDDETGLRYKAILNNTTGSKDLYEMIKRGDLFENSFCFYTEDDAASWQRLPDKGLVRRVSRIAMLFDISVVTHAAYPSTEVMARGYKEFIDQENQEINKTRDYIFLQPQMELLKLKIK